ncbi:hypothetical protein [Demequina silvatica]|uniref:hypothetical protein n=1 Tax=Demequina silvatica TaxID=1638988 RepID=UPI000780749F|nr:hypothetical protein [Demequina silvatica]
MDAERAVQARARHDVAALTGAFMPTTRVMRDIQLASLMRHGRRAVTRIMREAGLLRAWWARSPLLILVAPLTLTYAAVFGNALMFIAGGALLIWGGMSEPRLNRAERQERRLLLLAYRNAAADALDACVDRFAYGWGEEPGTALR